MYTLGYSTSRRLTAFDRAPLLSGSTELPHTTLRTVESPLPERPSPRSLHWWWPCASLTAGATLAVALHLAQAEQAQAVPDDAIAVVGTQAIPRYEYERALALLQAERRTPLTDTDRALALERLIEEEILVQAALEADVVRKDPRVAQALVQSLLGPTLLNAESSSTASGSADGATERARVESAAFDQLISELRADARVRRVHPQ